jgi:ribosome recycling factor
MKSIKEVLDNAPLTMEKSIRHLETELAKIRAGKANPSILENVLVDYYGTKVPIHQAASINTQDARTLIIQPWDKSMLTPIEKAIQMANLSLNPQNDGTVIRITIPPLTEERRKELTRLVRQVGEEAKIAIRSVRKESLEHLKKLQKEGLPEDEVKSAENKVQQITDQHIAKVDQHVQIKEKEILTV